MDYKNRCEILEEMVEGLNGVVAKLRKSKGAETPERIPLETCRECENTSFSPMEHKGKNTKIYCDECKSIYAHEPARWKKTGKRYLKERG